MIRKVREPSSGVRVTRDTYQQFIQDFLLRGGGYFGMVDRCVQNRQCVNHTLLGGSGHDPPEKNSCSEINSGRFW